MKVKLIRKAQGTPTGSPAMTAAALADAAQLLAGYAMRFGSIDRTACRHPDGTPESDSDHTVMLAWLAPALADVIAPQLDASVVAELAAVHDAVEVFAGDTPTLRISDDERAAKKAREQDATWRWDEEFGLTLPWLPVTICRYESQSEPEARFVRAVDKFCPKLVHLQNGATDLADYGMTAGELEDVLARQRADVESYAGEFAALLDLYDELAVRTIAALRALGVSQGAGAMTGGDLDQPPPLPGTGQSVHDLVCEDIRTRWASGSIGRAPAAPHINAMTAALREQKRIWVQRHGQPLRANNGRDAFRDLPVPRRSRTTRWSCTTA